MFLHYFTGLTVFLTVIVCLSHCSTGSPCHEAQYPREHSQKLRAHVSFLWVFFSVPDKECSLILEACFLFLTQCSSNSPYQVLQASKTLVFHVSL